METTLNPDGSASTHVVINCTLEDICKATSLRIEDAAFALKECGLLQRRGRVVPKPAAEEKDKDKEPNGKNEDGTASGSQNGRGANVEGSQHGKEEEQVVEYEDVISISREMIDAVAKARTVKRAMMGREFVILNDVEP